MENIKGYDYGKSGLEQSPISLQDLGLLKQTVLWSDEDQANLQKAGEILKDQVNDILDLWYGFVGGHAHLVRYFGKNGNPNMEYLTAVRARFGQWILDICQKPYDQSWLDYQHEIAKRHHKTKKNQTDGVEAVPIIHYRYMVAFIVPITMTIKSFLAKKGNSPEEVENMYDAWFKAVTLTVITWTYPYINQGEF